MLSFQTERMSALGSKAVEWQAPARRNSRLARVSHQTLHRQERIVEGAHTHSGLCTQARPSSGLAAGEGIGRRGLGLSLSNLAACPLCVRAASAAALAAAVAEPAEAKLAGVSTEQSPIDVPLRKLVRENKQGYTDQAGGNAVNPGNNGVVRRSALSNRRKVVECSYQTGAEGVTVDNNGFTLQVNVPKGSTALLNGKEHTLVQYHFHTPSEHAFDSQYTAMEVHLVHKDEEKGGYAVVGVLLEGHEGAAPLSALDVAIRGASASTGSKTTIPTPVNLQAALSVLVPESEEVGAIVNFPGSLTTPPCSEGVNWFLSTEIVGMPHTQIHAFENYRDTTGRVVRLGNNARPVQPISQRTLNLL